MNGMNAIPVLVSTDQMLLYSAHPYRVVNSSR